MKTFNWPVFVACLVCPLLIFVLGAAIVFVKAKRRWFNGDPRKVKVDPATAKVIDRVTIDISAN